MIVEDDPDILEPLATLLRLHGFEVSTASDGLDALAVLARGPAPGLILLDLMMPRMNGWDFRARQLEDPAISHIPVILFTGAADPDEPLAVLQAAGWLPKPFDMRALIGLVEQHCR
jgi:two-component system, chemotaxis family, chemotaxis protein CheY